MGYQNRLPRAVFPKNGYYTELSKSIDHNIEFQIPGNEFVNLKDITW
jgi:hypothetical protein